jgi:endonuclease/exonuclease/phosphatase family metal-dependent hydrolase
MRRVAALLTSLSVLSGAALLAGCTGGSDPEPEAATPPASTSSTAPVELSLLVFNVEYGGTRATDAVLADVDADVVGVLESYNRLPEIAAAAGYPYYNVGLQILSKYPILEPSGADGLYAFIEVRPGEAVAMINTHLDYVQYGPRRLARGVPVADVLATEDEVRLSSVEKLLPSADRLLADGWPLLFTGDLNEPSHLDWTTETQDGHGGVGPVAWPVSEALIDAGLSDAYRETHADPATDPGHTWGSVAGNAGPPERIDFAYVGGPVEVASSEVVGERGADGVDRGFPRWTSDHRAVLSQLSVDPAPIPTTVALSSRMVTVGDEVTVSYRLPETDGTVTLTGPTATSYDVTGTSGTVEVSTAALADGAYRVELADSSGEVLATNDLYVRPADARVRITTDAPSYAVGEPVTVGWTDGPANRWDWIGVYRADAADPATDSYLVWGYTGGHDAGALPPSTEGELVLGREHQGRPWPLPPGRYVAHYLLTDQYVSIGSTRFTVRRSDAQS